MIIKDIEKTTCTGCSACKDICPVNAIEIISDVEGFYIPNIISEKCIECNLCGSLCPSLNKTLIQSTKIGYIVRLKENKILKNSASGGAFAGIAKYLIETKNAFVVGAAIDKSLKVKHTIINKIENLKELQNSKYVQSYIDNIYSEVKKILEQGEIVLFTGTPCQIAGIYAVIPEELRKNLYTADLVCHGVSSPKFLERQLKEESKSKQGKVINFKFRYKNPKATTISSYMMMMMMEKGLPKIKRINQDIYFKLFIEGKNFRESCYNCKYANKNRIGDFTLGDCDSKEFYPKFHPKESNSILLLNSEKALKIWEELKTNYDYCILDIEREAQYNHQLNHPFKRPKERNGIYKDLLNTNWELLQSKYVDKQSNLDRYKLLFLLNTPSYLSFPLVLLKTFLSKLKTKIK